MFISISAIVDIVILLLLVGTVFYAMRLSSQLDILRNSKDELEQLVSSLAINIRRAHEAIQEMQEVASGSSEELQNLIHEAQDLSNEIQIINEAANNLADRLDETMSESPSHYDEANFDNLTRNVKKTSPRKARPSPSVDHFFIRDKEFEDFNDNDDGDGDDYDDRYEDEFRNLSSRAEKQLASALRRNRKFDA